MEPAMRNYLKTLREQSYVVIKPGYQESPAAAIRRFKKSAPHPEANKAKKRPQEISSIWKEVGLRSMKTVVRHGSLIRTEHH